MASPKLETFFVTDVAGTPVTGGAAGMSFEVYKDDQGTNVTQPTIVELAGGLYGFIPNFPVSTARSVIYVLNTGTNRVPARYYRNIRPEDWNDDGIPALQTGITTMLSNDTSTAAALADLQQILVGRWKIHTTGPDAFRLVYYAVDGVTVTHRFDLKNALGAAATLNPYERVPV